TGAQTCAFRGPSPPHTPAAPPPTASCRPTSRRTKDGRGRLSPAGPDPCGGSPPPPPPPPLKSGCAVVEVRTTLNVLLVHNPRAGGGRAGRLAPQVVERLRGDGVEVAQHPTRSLDDARLRACHGAPADHGVVARLCVRM